jgi:aldose 1-epimerase
MNAYSPADPTGRQFHLASADGRVTAHIGQVGASLRGLTIDGIDVVPPYPQGAPAPAASGTVLVPWPNRVRDGRWTQRGQTRQLAITEPALSNASHGLLRFAPYSVIGMDSDAVTLAATVFPQTGYPFQLDTSVRFAVTGSGLHVSHAVANVGADDAPVALGIHPYFMIGGVDTAELRVRSSGSARFVLDDRQLPVREEPVDAATDLRGAPRLGDLDLDTGYSDLVRDVDGRIRHELIAPDGRTLTVWQGEGFDYVQVFTTDRYPGQPLAVAIEPMTAPADALNSGRGLRWLAPGEAWETHWGVEFLGSE